MKSNQPEQSEGRHGAWLESIALVDLLREGNQPAAKSLLDSADDKDRVIGDALSLFSFFLRMQERHHPEDVASFLEASLVVGPPPTFGTRPFLA